MNMQQREEHSILFYTEGSSDKFYDISLLREGSDWSVHFAYGRRGTTGQYGYKVRNVGYESAKRAFDRVIAEKVGKGYTSDITGQPGSGYWATPEVGIQVPTRRVDRVPVEATALRPAVAAALFDAPVDGLRSGYVPQLLNPVGEAQLEALLTDDAWGMQEKYDGKHLTLHWDGHRMVAANKKNLACGCDPRYEPAMREIFGSDSAVVDGEAMGLVFRAYDLLYYVGEDLRGMTYSARHAQLVNMDRQFLQEPSILIAPMARGEEQKRTLLAALRARNAEGVVFKRLDGAWRAGRPASGGDMLKYKFVASATCRVRSDATGRHSIGLEVLDGNLWVYVGNCTVGQATDLPPAGACVEIRYLYAYRGGALYQPVYLGVRDDVTEEECVISQLKYKGEAVAEVAKPVVVPGAHGARRIRWQ